MFRGQEKNIYSKYMGRIKIKESHSDKKDIIFTPEEGNIYSQPYVNKYLSVADPSEDCYKIAKGNIVAILKTQYRSCYKCFEIFDQLKPLIDLEI